MSKRAVSVTLEEENLTWLRGRALVAGRRSLSATLDRLITQAREGRGPTVPGARSVVGTVAIAESDPELKGADDELRTLFQRSLGRRRRSPSRRTAGRSVGSGSGRGRLGG